MKRIKRVGDGYELRLPEAERELLASLPGQLVEMLDASAGDPEALEEIARKDLGLIKPGEKLFIIRDAPPADQRPGGK